MVVIRLELDEDPGQRLTSIHVTGICTTYLAKVQIEAIKGCSFEMLSAIGTLVTAHKPRLVRSSRAGTSCL
jgi:hypothetical protein